jgi:hypothetical protein
VKTKCRVCHKRAALPPFSVIASYRRNAREWRITVCQDCWRAFEAMLDEAGAVLVSQLPIVGEKGPWWFR